MATVAQLMSMARLECNKSSTMAGLSDADLLPFLNVVVYSKIQEEIRKRVDGEYFSYPFTSNIVYDQNKYLMPQATSTVPGVLKIIKLAIKELSTSEHFTVLFEKGTKHVSMFTDYEETKANTKYYDLRNGYIYLYPTPTENVSNGIKIIASVTLPDLLTTSTEADIFPNHQEMRQFQNVILAGLRAVIYGISGDTNMKQLENQTFESEIQKMCRSLQKSQEPVIGEEPNLSHLY